MVTGSSGGSGVVAGGGEQVGAGVGVVGWLVSVGGRVLKSMGFEI